MLLGTFCGCVMSYIIAFFFRIIYDKDDHGFLKIIFFTLTFPAMAGLAYYAKVIAVDDFASQTAIDVLTTFYRFTIWMTVIAYAYLGIRTVLWGLSKYKTKFNRLEPWERDDALI